jgi:hypothetical protein
MRRLLFILVLSLVVLGLVPLTFAQTGTAPITASAVWQPGSDFLAQARAACEKVSPSQK